MNKKKNKNLNMVRKVVKKKTEHISPTANVEKTFGKNEELIKKQQGYYNYLFGIIYAQKNLGTSEKYFKQAIKLGLGMDHDLAMAKMSLAGIAMQKRRKREAQTLLTEAKKLDKNQMLGDQLKLMQQQLKKI